MHVVEASSPANQNIARSARQFGPRARVGLGLADLTIDDGDAFRVEAELTPFA